MQQNYGCSIYFSNAYLRFFGYPTIIYNFFEVPHIISFVNAIRLTSPIVESSCSGIIHGIYSTGHWVRDNTHLANNNNI